MTPRQAKEITIKVWQYLVDHPDIYSKMDLPEKLYNLISAADNDCQLCQLFCDDTRDCPNCPLSKAGNCCFYEESAFDTWGTADVCDDETRQQAAQKIVDIVTVWEV